MNMYMTRVAIFFYKYFGRNNSFTWQFSSLKNYHWHWTLYTFTKIAKKKQR